MIMYALAEVWFLILVHSQYFIEIHSRYFQDMKKRSIVTFLFFRFFDDFIGFPEVKSHRFLQSNLYKSLTISKTIFAWLTVTVYLFINYFFIPMIYSRDLRILYNSTFQIYFQIQFHFRTSDSELNDRFHNRRKKKIKNTFLTKNVESDFNKLNLS